MKPPISTLSSRLDNARALRFRSVDVAASIKIVDLHQTDADFAILAMT